MDALETNFNKLGKYVVGVILIWLGLVGLINPEIGFTNIGVIPGVDFAYLAMAVYISQIAIGLAIFNSSLRKYVRPLVIVYFLILVYNFYILYPQLFEPAIPYFSELGQDIFLEALLLFAGFKYIKFK